MSIDPSATLAAPAALPPELLQQVIANPAIPKIYAQGFANFASALDITVVVLNCSIPTGVVTMSYGAAKGFVASMGEAIARFERSMGSEVLTGEQAQAKLLSE